MACFRPLPRRRDNQVGQVEQHPGQSDRPHQRVLVEAAKRGERAAAEHQAGQQSDELEPQKDAAGRLAAEAGVGQLGLQLAQFARVFRLQRFGQCGTCLLQHPGHGVGLFERALAFGFAAFVRVLKFFEAFQLPRLAGGHEIQRPPRQGREGPEQCPGHQAFKVDQTFGEDHGFTL